MWGLPFFILAGHHGKVMGLQAAVLVPTILFELRPWPSDLAYWTYVPLMVGTWLALTAALFRSTWLTRRLRPSQS